MDNNENVQNFALGLIVAVVVFLLLKREFGHGATADRFGGGGGGESASGGGGGCGCGGGSGQGSRGPISIGGQSYNDPGSGYAASSVIPLSNPSQPSSAASRLLASLNGRVYATNSVSGGGRSAPTVQQGGGGGYNTILSGSGTFS
jgi:hypothetical protein